MTDEVTKFFGSKPRRIPHTLGIEAVEEYISRRANISSLICQIEKVAPVAVFGGMVRDADIYGLLEFSSDIDLVVECQESLDLGIALEGNYTLGFNKMGGYRLSVDNVSIDLWALGATRAISAGYVKGESLSVLPSTTFLSCNSVAYDLTRKELYTGPLYSKWVDYKQVEINLEATADPAGMAVRAFSLVKRDPYVSFGPKLRDFLHREVDQH